MATSVILTNWTVYYAGDSAGYKQIRWTGSTGTNTVNELYSELMSLFNESAQNTADATTPMVSITPSAYQIGAFDAGDTEPWFIDPESVKHLTGGAIETKKWTFSTGVDAGIFLVHCSSLGTVVAGDVGNSITTSAGSSTGTLLYVDTTTNELWIRPTDSSSTHDWSQWASPTYTLTVNGHTATQDTTATTGENLWSNIYSIGTIADNTYVYVAQNNTAFSSWWDEGHVDILVLVSKQGTIIDNGLITVYARQYTKTYDNFVVDISGGGRSAIPISTGSDINNANGYRQLAGSSGAGTFTTGIIYQGASYSAATAKGYVTLVGGTGSNPVLTYYLLGDLSTFAAGGTTTYLYTDGDPRTVSCSTDSVTDTGAALLSLVPTFGLDTTLDVDSDTTNEDYSIIFDLTSSITLPAFYQRLKYITRRGFTTLLDTVEGQQYIGIDNRIDYVTLTGAVNEGTVIYQTLADGSVTHTYVVAHNTTSKYIMVRDTTGEIETGAGAAYIGTDASNNITMTDATLTPISPIKVSPFGTFAGGRFFGARGVALKNVPAAYQNSYELIDNDGEIRTPPVTRSFIVTNVIAGSEVRLITTDGTRTEIGTGIETSQEQLDAVAVFSGGSGYSPSDVLTIAGGTSSTAAQITVQSIDGGGAVTAATVTTAGDYTLRPTNISQNAATGGGGAGATFALTFADLNPFSYSYVYSTDINAILIVFHRNYLPIRVAITLEDSDLVFPTQQTTDRVYS